jgi:hypothetical protein
MRSNGMIRIGSKVVMVLSVALLTGCARTSEVLNPFYEAPSPVALQGEMTDRALTGGTSKVETARKAFEEMREYRAAHLPEPTYPVLQPAVVRVMWIPDHLNKNGDMVPAHYYYLKVLRDRWAVQDAFELEQQLQGPSGAASGNIPYVLEDIN